ncbi:hypothetical protein QCM8_17 [Bacillus phage QCM8]|nr:hypothetical protein QCM8_17 [Bacillus phage QCM8]
MGKTYTVAVPIVAKLLVEIENPVNEQDAIKQALAVDMELRPHSVDHTVTIDEWDMHKHVVQGNVYYGNINEPHVVAIDDDE